MAALDATLNELEPKSRARSAWSATRPMRWAAGLGGLSGLIAGGVGSRVAMRLIALADSSADGTFTDSKATVGEFTMGGTFGLLMLGTVAGVMGGLLYLGLRRWLPVPPAWNGMAFSVFTFVTVGFLLFDSANADFQIFEPVLLVIGLFSMLFFVNGLLLAALMDRFHPEPEYKARARVSRLVAGVLILITVAGLLAFVGSTLGMIEDEGTCLRAVGGGEGCAVRADP